MAEENQAETQEETQEEAVSEAEVKEQVKGLLEQEPETEVAQETQETQETQEEVQEETQTKTQETQEPLVVDDELVEKYPQLRMYLGKPIKNLADAYANLVGKMHGVIKENNELKGKLSKTSLDELGAPPDMVENPDKFKEWLDKRDKMIREQAISEQSNQPEQIDYLAVVQKNLPEGVDSKRVADAWSKFNSARLFDEVGQLRPEIQKLYSEHPQIMVDEILNFYNLSSKANQNDFTIKSEAKKEAYKQTKENFKQAQKTKKESSQINSVQRTSEATPEDEILTKIYQLAQSG